MATVNLYTYFEVDTNDRVQRFGSLNVPQSISLTGTGTMSHKVYNDVDTTTTPATLFLTTEGPQSSGFQFVAVKATQGGWISWGDLDADSSNADTGDMPVTANVWSYIVGNTFNQHGGKSATNRLGQSTSVIKEIYYKRSGGGAADIEVIACY